MPDPTTGAHPSGSTPAEPADPAPDPIRGSMDAGRLVRGILASADLAAVLRFLNQRARFRFTGVYRTDPPLLRNVCLFDRENPDLMLGGDATPLERTYCGIVSSTRSPFYVEDAISDTRVANHAARESVVSYAGVPLRNPAGHVVGTLCHFDVRPRVLPEHELDVLQAVAGAISSWLTERGATLADPNASHPADVQEVSRRVD